ncbi:MAG: D-alanyl-D-alanine carboxypeptidase/D-alanyl-D-alanine-endopeptidase, partial [Gemmatimonadota bacterium]
RFTRAEGTWHIMAAGTVRLGGKPDVSHIALPDPNLYAALMFRQSLGQAGIAVHGGTRSTTDSMATRDARNGMPLAEVDSRPLRDWIFPILNTSQNWYAEMLLKQLGRTFGTSGSWQEGLRVERRFLIDSVKADSSQFQLRDGSGLSAQNLVSPLTFAQLLQFVRAHPRYPVFAAGLPQSGVSGSLKNRFVKTPLEGRVRAKTGSISAVNTLSGYLESVGDSTDLLPGHGPLRIFSIQANHHLLGGRSMIQAIDSVVVEIGKGVRGPSCRVRCPAVP